MSENQNTINQLLQKLEVLMQKQNSFYKEIYDLREEILRLKSVEKQEVADNIVDIEYKTEIKTEEKRFVAPPPPPKQNYYHPPKSTDWQNTRPKINIDFEKFIGENLISKIGVIITIIGVAIGVKYSIEHQLVSPLTRIILGYLMGFGLLGIGFKLKRKYENYSAVLISGSIAIMYFITFAAYNFYELIPQAVAFGIMVLFTVFTVIIALNYNKQIIAHIGMVGAYAVPFLLSDGSGEIAIMFTYMSIINIGILIIAFKKYWKPIYYTSFVFTWLIYFSWFITQYEYTKHMELAFLFVFLFFAIFYVIFLAYKLMRNEKFEIQDIALMLSNSFVFYGISYTILTNHPIYIHFLGLFTIGNAMIHLIVSIMIYRQKQSDRNIIYLIAGLGLIFLTIAIPVQLDGSWVTLLWVGEAALLFSIGRTKQISFYEILSYPIMLLSFISILLSWVNTYMRFDINEVSTMITPIFNINFLTSILFIALFVLIYLLNQNKKYSQPFEKQNAISKIINFSIPAILLFILYFSFRMEIANYYDQLYAVSEKSTTFEMMQNATADFYNSDLLKFKSIWILNYSLMFLTILSFINIKKLKNANFGLIILVFNIFIILSFLFEGLFHLSELRVSYLYQSQYYHCGFMNIGIRYICFAFAAALFFAIYKSIHQDFMKVKFKIAFETILYLSIVWVGSSELINWMDITHSAQSYKLGLSILWGVYALLIIVMGIWKKKKHLRIGAIVLFAVTLLKLFLYDISYLDTLSKTIVFVSLGILLLIISFLYTKYKNTSS